MTCPECHADLPADTIAGLCPRCVAQSLKQTWGTLSQDTSAPVAGGSQPVLPGWELLEPLGSGGQGIVWRAVHEETDELGAAKVFRGAQVEDSLRMQAEVEALRALDHPGIVKVLDAGTTSDGRFFITTEFVEGCDLQRLMQVQRLTVERALEIAKCVAAALGHAHERQLIHRDLKPANVLIGRDSSIKLADFSLVRQLDGPASVVTLTREGMAFGTPYYLAPEVMQGQAATVASDLYALGVLLYEMLAGAPPAGRFTRLSEKCDLPREADRLVESLLAEDAAVRPATAGAVMEELALIAALRRGELAARLKRHRWKLAGAFTASVLLAAALGYLIPHPLPVPPPPARQNAQGHPNPAAATRMEPWKNSLEMAFIPVPGIPQALVCRHETRMRDFLPSLEGEGAEWEAWQEAFGVEAVTRVRLSDVRPSGWQPLENSSADVVEGMNELGLSPEAAACGVNIFMARRFCAWLTWREQRMGRLQADEYYRLPTDAEWSLAAGMPAERELVVERRHKSLQATPHPWGDAWPPPANFANYAGVEARNERWPLAWLSLPEKNDAFPRASPVGSFPESKTGLWDVWGNVWEWCESPPNVVSAEMTLRGGSWVEGGYKALMRMDYRRFERANTREACIGFRCVLVVPGLPAAGPQPGP